MARLLTYTETREQTYRIEACCACGVEFGMTEELYKERLRDRELFYCPNGHAQHYAGKTDHQRLVELEAEKTALQARLQCERDATAAAERKAERAEAEVKRMKKRAAASLCPYCNRSFATVRLQRHIHSKHPEKSHD